MTRTNKKDLLMSRIMTNIDVCNYGNHANFVSAHERVQDLESVYNQNVKWYKDKLEKYIAERRTGGANT